MLYVKKLDPRALLPTVQHPGEDLGYDLYCLEDTEIAGPSRVRTGIAAYYENYNEKYGLLIRDRSSMAAKGFFVVGGVVDYGYRGEIMVMLSGSGQIAAQTKIAQAIPLPVMTYAGIHEVDVFAPTMRGGNGFGSSGA